MKLLHINFEIINFVTEPDHIENSSAEVDNNTSKCNGVTHYHLCHVLKAITLNSDNGSNFDTAIIFKI
jgi:hypothetical protein